MASAASSIAPDDVPAAEGPDRWWRLIQIDLKHDYHGSEGRPGACTELAIAPTPETRRRLTRFGLLLRSRADGLDILCSDRLAARFRDTMKKERETLSAMAPIDRAFYFGPPLLFTLTLRDPAFLTFTDMPDGFGSGARALGLANGPMMDRVLTASDWTPWPSGPPTPEAPAEPQPKPRAAEAKPQATPVEASPPPVFRPAFLGKGGYQSPADIFAGQSERALYRDGGTKLPLGLVDIYLTREAAGLAQGSDRFPINLMAGEKDGPTIGSVGYGIRFAARKTRWRYVVTGRERPLGKLAIVDANGDDAGFKPAGPPRFAPAAQCLVAQAPRTMHRRAASGLSLVSIEGGTGRSRRRTLIDPLPTPGPGALSLEDGQAFSDIHLFV